MCITCSRNVLHEVNVQFCTHCPGRVWCVPLLLLSVDSKWSCQCSPTHTRTQSCFPRESKITFNPSWFSLCFSSSQYLRSLSQWDILSIAYTLFWGLNMDNPSFVGSEMISEFTFCTLLDLFSSPLSSCIFYCCLIAYIYICCSLSTCSSLVQSLLTKSTHPWAGSWDNTIHG